MREVVINGIKETEAFGRKLGEEAQPGDILALIGDLGTGKTTLTKSIARGLGVKEDITSPTFNIVNEYHSGRLPL
ncbi:MAG: tRNA (adenosine(37)-N6)-threonylcarbamoyltransferase complex ATPase subunit type 1 TsaE, partial [Eubacterium sp.]